MKSIALALGFLVAAGAGAADSPSAPLVGQRLISSYPGSPILVCQYRVAQVKYEVVATSPRCAPYLALEQDSPRASFAAAAPRGPSTP